MDPEYPPSIDPEHARPIDVHRVALDRALPSIKDLEEWDPRILASLQHIGAMLSAAVGPFDDLADWSAYPKKACLLDDVLTDLGDLARFLGGDETSFTGELLRLIAKARFDPENFNRFATGFPRHVAAWVMWHNLTPAAPMTASDLLELLKMAHRKGVQG